MQIIAENANKVNLMRQIKKKVKTYFIDSDIYDLKIKMQNESLSPRKDLQLLPK